MFSLALQLINEAKEKRLTCLNLGSCGLKELPNALFELTWLEQLILSNGWEEYSFEKKRWEQYITENKDIATSIEFIHPDICKLTELKSLILKDQHVLYDLSPLNSLIHLTELNISRTPVKNLRPIKKVLEKSPSFLLNVDKCHQLTDPPLSNSQGGNEAILRYWQEINDKETVINNQTKLIFVGNSRAGKTSLWRFLKDNIYDKDASSTHGIKTEIWNTETLDMDSGQNLFANIWDFGGQEYYHATHRLFFSHNAVYVLVWEKDTNSQGTRIERFILDDDESGEVELNMDYFPVSYWLDNIRYYGGNSHHLIVQNKVDEEKLKANYSDSEQNIEDFFQLSIKNAFGFQKGNQKLKRYDLRFQDFKERLLEIMRSNATQFKIVKYHLAVQKELEILAQNTEFITLRELEKIAFEKDVTKTPDIQNLLVYLKNFTNTILYFPDIEVLKDYLFLNPTHISRDIYKILNKQVRDNNGRFDLAHIQTRLNCDSDEATRYVALMIEFDLIFEKNKTVKEGKQRQFVTPQYLPPKEHLSDDIQFFMDGINFKVGFYLQFKSFVPRSMMLRFIAQNGVFAYGEYYWYNTIIYKSTNSNLFIKVEYSLEKAIFSIEIQDQQKQTSDMQNIISQFTKLDNGDYNIKISNDGVTYIELSKIREHQNENAKHIYESGKLIPLSRYDWLRQSKEINEETTSLNQLKETVNNLIEQAETKKALEAIAVYAAENNEIELKNDAVLLQASCVELNRKNNLGMLSFEEAQREYAKLNNRVLNLISK